ncbi:MAG: DUF3098 domain-containing protein [Bacteroidaceae bacterium]|nr:DUF3098 domain-containing protein [Bacteroidaceae bacterium]MBQ8009284.1 DUF3098 domain-containing protein [Bacteroidaceae bacterium]MBR1542913.1 DUF3098 domain-containing protein [Bacteroidaceae bacterium]
MDKKNFAFDKKNLMLIAVGMIVVIIGFLLMTGPSTTIDNFEPDIFSVRRVKVAPMVCLAGFILMIYAVIRKPREE